MSPSHPIHPRWFQLTRPTPDLDSLCSTLVYAYLRTHAVTPTTLHIPLSNLPRADLALRTEMTAVLQAADLDLKQLLTLSDLPDHLSPEHTRWFLVDHNSLTGQLARYKGQVVGCIDHHEDEGVVSKNVEPRVIEPCGSCMSLIVEETRTLWSDLVKMTKTAEDAEENRKLAMLGLAPILIDTINFTEKHKVKPKDISAADFLEEKVQGFQGYDRKMYFDRVAAVKEDISSLGFRDILRKDYKEWTEGNNLKLGVSSVVKGLNYLTEKKDDQTAQDGFLGAVAAWAEERELDVVSVMTAANNERDQFERNLLVWGRTDKGIEGLRKFADGSSEKLQLTTFGDGQLDDKDNRKAWLQGNLAASRKQVAPLLREALANVS